jgi:lipopolysaccharide export system ATP-binding protein
MAAEQDDTAATANLPVTADVPVTAGRPAATDSPVTTDSHILAVQALYKRFGRREVVRGVDFAMKNGEVAGLLGPNGAGKTTIFYIIVGFHRPSGGSVLLDGKNIAGEPMYRRARLGIT